MRNDHTNVAEMQLDALTDNVQSVINQAVKGDIRPNDAWLELRNLVDRVSSYARYIEQQNRGGQE